jgi:hypothetical protein
MSLLCVICCFVKEHEDSLESEADFIINGQSVCMYHSGYVQGGDFSQAIYKAKMEISRT